MVIKKFLEDIFVLFVFSLFPLTELYGYFIFIGIFFLDNTEFPTGLVEIIFIIYHLFLVLKIIFYMQILTTENRSTIEIFPRNKEDNIQKEIRDVNPFIMEQIFMKNNEKSIICRKCETYKPPRAHHCNRCNRCYLKFDHHCLFLDTCINFYNYKFFIQFLIINLISLIFNIFVISADFLVKNDIMIYIIVNYIVLLSLFSIELIVNLLILIFHLNLISRNETTVEYYAINAYLNGNNRYFHVFQEGPIKDFSSSKDRRVLNPYNLGLKQNWIQVFGKNFLDWIKPKFTSIGDGITFPNNQENSLKNIIL